MRLDELAILLPCHSLEDFPTHYQGAHAEGVLACWAALWQPGVLAIADKMPTWQRADSPPEPGGTRLLTVPLPSEAYLPTGWLTSVAEAGLKPVVQRNNSRAQIAAEARAVVGLDDVSPELSADLQAVGFAYLQLELLARRMRYSSSLDEGQFEREARGAAAAILSNDEETARRHLRAGVEVLTEARERFYPVDAWLLDLTLVADSTLDERLARELELACPTNLLMSGRTVEALAARSPELLEQVRAAWEAQTAAVVGGTYDEPRTPIDPLEATLADLRRGRDVYMRHLGQRAVVYGRRRFGLSPILPQLLYRGDFLGALHFTLDDGQFPKEEQSKVRWEGLDGSAIDALLRVPVDAADPGAFLALSEKLGAVMDLDYVASLCFAHWPGAACSWYDDLRRVSALGPVFGRFATLDDYFRSSESPGRMSRHSADQYRSPYLKQDVAGNRENPLTSVADAHRADQARQAAEFFQTVMTLLTGDAPVEVHDSRVGAELLAARLPASAIRAEKRTIVFNPLNFTRKVLVEGPARIVEVPGSGFVCLEPAEATPARSAGKKLPAIAGPDQLANEQVLVRMDAASGAIRSIHEHGHRGAVLSQQLAMRQAGPAPRPGEPWTDHDERAIYSRMVAELVEVVESSADVGEIVSRGRLVSPDDVALAQFEQRVRLLRGSRTIELSIKLDPIALPAGDPWLEYFAARFAWSSSEAALWRSVGMTGQPTDARRIEAPHYVEIREEKQRVAVLTGGMPYHRRVGDRFLDTLLIVPGESRREFRLGIAVGSTHPLQAALDLTASAHVVERHAPPPGAASGWFFHLDARNVVATSWAPLVEEGRVVGFRARILETEGRPGRVRLRAFRTVAAAQQFSFSGSLLAELKIEGQAIQLDFTACEWMEVVARFSESAA